MEHVESLVRWIITYSVSGGFWHFIACYFVLSMLNRTLAFVRVNVTMHRKSKSKAKRETNRVGS